MKMLAGTVAALVMSATGAYAQVLYPVPPAPAPRVFIAPAPAPPVVVAPAPSYIPGPYPGSVVVNPYTGRWCTFEPSGWHWCWRP